MKLRVSAVFVTALVVGPAMATAQNVGDRVRITTGNARVVGEVAAIGQDSIRTTSRAYNATIAWESVDLLERRTGSRWLLGTGIGAGAGVAAALILFATEPEPEPCTGFCLGDDFWEELFPTEVVIGTMALLGSIPGALIGLLFPRWETVETDRGGDMIFFPSVDLRLGPQAHPALSLGVHLRF